MKTKDSRMPERQAALSLNRQRLSVTGIFIDMGAADV
jgi:hypothetical protein